MTHRGPDDEGVYADADVCLGMRRLKIIDLHKGHQPIFNEDRTIVVVYNGEIYNFQSLRKDLERTGHQFNTQSDTETIVHLYEEYGERCSDRLRGMFAFALWDKKRKKLLLARDRLGIKPLFYSLHSGVLVFASELKALLHYPRLSYELNFNALHDYLSYMCVPAPETIFKNVFKLEPGQLLVCQNGAAVKKKYWDAGAFTANGHDVPLDEDSAKEKMDELMKESVHMHLVSDVPLGVFLSGGLDSSTIVAIMSEVSNNVIKTFSIGFEDERYNELDNARLVAERFGTKHHEYIVNPIPIDEIQNILCFFDEPFADSSAIPTYYVSKFARDNVTVALSGDGGDEVFGGYGNYKADKIGLWMRRFPLAAVARALSALPHILPESADNLSKDAQAKKLLRAALMSPEDAHLSWLECFSEKTKNQLYSGSLKRLGQRNSLDLYKAFFRSCRTDDLINQCICVDMQTILPNDYLTKVDRMSMANSLEVRVPFLDHKLVEFALSLRSLAKLRGLTTKFLLKKIMKKRLPQDILKGKKRGFSIPLAKWFKEDFSVLLREFLSEEAVKKRGYFNYGFIHRMKDHHISGEKDYSKQLWALVCLEIWHRIFMK